MLLDLNEEYQIKKGKIGMMLTEDKEEVPSISFLGFFCFLEFPCKCDRKEEHRSLSFGIYIHLFRRKMTGVLPRGYLHGPGSYSLEIKHILPEK